MYLQKLLTSRGVKNHRTDHVWGILSLSDPRTILFLNLIFFVCVVYSFLLSIVVANAMYTFHSLVTPYLQEDFFLNYCWRSLDGQLYLDRWCHVFIARVPALYTNTQSKDTVSFESACAPGNFIRQKNYKFLLKKRDGTELFGKKPDFIACSTVWRKHEFFPFKYSF